jgi:hypothetical protein
MTINSDIPFLECSKISMSENSRPFMWILPCLTIRGLVTDVCYKRCHLDALGLSFSTYLRILFSSEYFHHKIFTSRGQAVGKHWFMAGCPTLCRHPQTFGWHRTPHAILTSNQRTTTVLDLSRKNVSPLVHRNTFHPIWTNTAPLHSEWWQTKSSNKTENNITCITHIQFLKNHACNW